MLARMAQAWAPDSLRLPPVIFRMTTAGRRARSAALLVPSTFGSCRNVVRRDPYLRIRAASRSASASFHDLAAQIPQPRLDALDLPGISRGRQAFPTLLEPQRLLSQPLALPEERVRGQRRTFLDRIPQLPQQMRQALLLRTVELVIDRVEVADQRAAERLAQQFGDHLPAPRAVHVIQRVRVVGQRPQLAVLPVDPPAGLVGMNHLGGPQHQIQPIVLPGQPVAQPPDLLDHRPGTELQPGQVGEQLGDLPQRQAIADPHHRRRGQGVDPQLGVRQVRGRRLILRPRFHAFAATRAIAAVRVVAGRHHARRNDVLHHPPVMLHLAQLRPAMRTAQLALRIHRQGHILMNVDLPRQRPQGRRMTLRTAGLTPRPSPARSASRTPAAPPAPPLARTGP